MRDFFGSTPLRTQPQSGDDSDAAAVPDAQQRD